MAACLADPAPVRSDAGTDPAPPRQATVHLRVALSREAGTCSIDSANVRVRASAGKEWTVPMQVSDSALEADVAVLDSGSASFAVSAYGAGGELEFFGESSWDPDLGNAAVTITLGRVGRVHLEAGFQRHAID